MEFAFFFLVAARVQKLVDVHLFQLFLPFPSLRVREASLLLLVFILLLFLFFFHLSAQSRLFGPLFLRLVSRNLLVPPPAGELLREVILLEVFRPFARFTHARFPFFRVRARLRGG